MPSPLTKTSMYVKYCQINAFLIKNGTAKILPVKVVFVVFIIKLKACYYSACSIGYKLQIESWKANQFIYQHCSSKSSC